MTPTITRRGIVTIALALAGLTLVWIALSMSVSAQDITAWATPVPEGPNIPALAKAIVAAIIAIVRQILDSLSAVIVSLS